MNMKDWAKQEIEIACKRDHGDEDVDEFYYTRACLESAYKAFECLLGDGHSGLSIRFTQAVLNRLIDGKALTPIEDTPDVWSDVVDRDSRKDAISYQCNRMSSLFKYVYIDGTVRYCDVDRVRMYSADDSDSSCCWYNGFIANIVDEKFPISMPYFPKSKPYRVYVSEYLRDPKNGDVDTIGVLYVITPDGEHVDINRFFTESGPTFVEISSEEYANIVSRSPHVK